METAVQTADFKTAKQLLKKELKDLQASIDFVNIGTYVKAKVFWNISRQELYTAEGYKSMRSWCEKTSISYRRVQQLIQIGDAIAAVSFNASTPESDRTLTLQHVKAYADAQRLLAGEERHDPLLLESHDIADLAPVHHDDDERKTLQRTIRSKRRRDAEAAEERAATAPKGRLTREQLADVARFTKRFGVPRTEDELLRFVFTDSDAMIAAFRALDRDVQGEILDQGINSLLDLRR
ncbi:MAG: hypothetical protein HY962_07055 [Ignavibacteriae bacterium]|nr:hypothetical protein [Ignavibacteriota bacterium]